MVLPALTRVLLEVLACVQGSDRLRVVNRCIKEENPLNHFDELIEFLLVLALIKRRLDVVKFGGARLLGSRLLGWWWVCQRL
jgi:hypothetical protein